jgi:hypothetical protein
VTVQVLPNNVFRLRKTILLISVRVVTGLSINPVNPRFNSCCLFTIRFCYTPALTVHVQPKLYTTLLASFNSSAQSASSNTFAFHTLTSHTSFAPPLPSNLRSLYMKPIFTLLTFTLLAYLNPAKAHGYFAPPTTVAINLVATATDGNQISLSFTAGNGARRIIVARKDNPVTAVPVNGVNYNASNSFGAGNQIAPGEYVVFNNTGSSAAITNLVASSTYHFAVFEYNGSGASIEYLMTPARQSGTTFFAPSGQPYNLAINNINGNSMRLSWTNPTAPDNGSGRLVLVREGAPVNVNPVDQTTYTAATTFGSGSEIGAGNYVVFISNGTNVTVTNLKPNTTYHFAVFEYKGSTSLVYNVTNAPTASATTLPRPTQPATTVTYPAVEGNSIHVSFSGGNGARRLVIARQGSPVSFVPQDGATYAGSAAFGSGDQVAPGEFVVYNGPVPSVGVTNLTIGTTYHFAEYEYDGVGPTSAFLTTGTHTSKATLSAPTVATSDLSITNAGSSSFTLSWQNGDGSKRMVVLRRDAPVQFVPVNFTPYTQGTSLGNNQTIPYVGSGSSTTISGLTPGFTYHVTVYEFNGTAAPVYLTANAPVASQIISNTPTVPASGVQFSNVEGNRMNVSWMSGNGGSRMVVVRAGSPVTAVPVDGVSYTYSTTIATAPQLTPGQYIVYLNPNGPITVSGLTPGVMYHYAVYELNRVNSVPYYLTTNPGRGNQMTQSAPLTNSSNMTISDVSGNDMLLTWQKGSGQGRIVLVRAGSDVNAVPANLTGYTADADITQATQIGSGNYVVYNGTGNSVNVFRLNPDVTYYYKVFEYNGAVAPVYLTSGVLSANQRTLERPSVNATAFTNYQTEGNKLSVRWTPGNGLKRIVLCRQGAPVNVLPVDGTVYSASAAFGSGQQLGAGNFVLADNEFSTVATTDLSIGTTYHYAVFEYDGEGSNRRYQTVGYLTGVATTLSAPVQQATNVLFSQISNNSVSVNWTPGDGGRHILIGRRGAPVNATPQDLQTYVSSSSFGAVGTAIGTDNFVLSTSTVTNLLVTNLQGGTTYHFAVFTFNGNSGPVYNLVNPATGSVTTLGPPQTQAASVVFSNTGVNTSLKISWSNGSGQRRLVLMKEGAAVDAQPVDNVAYAANTFFGSGAQLGAGNYAVFSGVGNEVTVTNINPNKVYHVAVFEFNQFAAGPTYLMTNPARAMFSGFPLPVKLVSFAAAPAGNSVVLKWKTAKEINSEKFVVQRSVNGSSYDDVATIAAKGNSATEQSYQYTDAQPLQQAYYRLKMVDADGKMAYSAVVLVKLDAASQQAVKVYPTVFQTKLNVQLQASEKALVQISLISMTGAVMQTWQRTAEAGSNGFVLDVANLAAGSYVLRMTTKEKVWSERVLKQ